MKLHLRYKNLHPHIVGAAERLFADKPWQLDVDGQEQVGERFLTALSETYGVSQATLAVGAAYDNYIPAERADTALGDNEIIEPAEIDLAAWSITRLFSISHLHLREEGAVPDDGSLSDTAWAYSLFYRVKPVMFRARVREGRMDQMTARDTYTAESWARLEDAGVTDQDGNLTVSPMVARDILNEQPQDSDTEIAEIDAQDTELTEQAVFSGYVSLTEDMLPCLNRDALRRLAAEHGIPGRGSMTRDQLESALREAGVRG